MSLASTTPYTTLFKWVLHQFEFIHVVTLLQETSFTCDGKEFGGYYADPEMDCQAYHICLMVCVMVIYFRGLKFNMVI